MVEQRYNASGTLALMSRLYLTLLLSVAAAAADRYHPEPAPQPAARLLPGEDSAEFWYREARGQLEERIANHANMGTARNVVMFLGDGMSVPTLAAARALLGQRRGRPGEEAQLSFEAFPAVGLAKTYCADAQIADSACTATAYLCGVKANSGTLGLTAAVPRWNCTASQNTAHHLSSIAAWALEDGRDAGIVTTTRLTHASPAGAYARSANRGWENDAQVRAAGHDPAACPDIAQQLIHEYPGNRFKVILGGGRREFLPINITDEEGTDGLRADGRNLIEEWRADKAARDVSSEYIWHRQQLLNSTGEAEYLLGIFEGNHLMYHMEGPEESEPTLAELTTAAMRRLARNPRGYFLFVEGGRIDHAHHDNYVHLALDETLELSAAVQAAAQLGDPRDTLLVVTADHAHVMAFNGYTRRGGDILGASDSVGDDGVPYLTLSYANGPGFRPHVADGVRANFAEESGFEARDLRWRAHVEVPLESETHGGDDVAVFARGPRHHVFAGLYEQSQLPHLMAYAACIGPGLRACHEPSAAPPARAPRPALALAALALAAKYYMH